MFVNIFFIVSLLRACLLFQGLIYLLSLCFFKIPVGTLANCLIIPILVKHVILELLDTQKPPEHVRNCWTYLFHKMENSPHCHHLYSIATDVFFKIGIGFRGVDSLENIFLGWPIPISGSGECCFLIRIMGK